MCYSIGEEVLYLSPYTTGQPTRRKTMNHLDRFVQEGKFRATDTPFAIVGFNRLVGETPPAGVDVLSSNVTFELVDTNVLTAEEGLRVVWEKNNNDQTHGKYFLYDKDGPVNYRCVDWSGTIKPIPKWMIEEEEKFRHNQCVVAS